MEKQRQDQRRPDPERALMDADTVSTSGPDPTWPRRFIAALPTGLALLLIAAVWAAGAVWSFDEQTAFALAHGFKVPQLLPLVLDGMAIAMAAVAFAASLDARPAVSARLGTLLAIALSAGSNIAGAWDRSAGDPLTIALAGSVPVVAMVAFEVLLAEIRKQVMRRRGQPAPLPVPPPRLIRLVLAPWPTFTAWRRLALEATDPAKAFGMERPTAGRSVGRGPVRATATVAEQTQTPAAVESAPEPAAITDRPHQTPDPRATRTPVRTPRPSPARAGLVRPPTPVRLVQSDRDEQVLAELRVWRRANDGQLPSINTVQQIDGGGRSRAIRLRDRLAATTDDRAAV